MPRARRTALAAGLTSALVAGLFVGGPGPAATPADAAAAATTSVTGTGKRTVMVVGNNWDGTATIVDARTKRRLTTISVIPDEAQEMRDILLAPDRLAFFLGIQQLIGEGNNQYVDDAFTTRNGRFLAVSRPSFADVVWIDIAKAAAGRSDSIVAEAPMDGYRTDHMGVSPDRTRLVVSDSLERQVIEFSMVNRTLPDGTRVRIGQRLRTFPSGDTPHENNYIADGRKIVHASIGRVYTPGDYQYYGPVDASTVHDAVKADRWLQIVRTSDFRVLKRWDLGREMAEAGYPGFSSAVRPMAISPDERFFYLQLSFHHGYVEFDTRALDPSGGGDYTLGGVREPARGVVTRVVNLPVSDEVAQLPREQYVLDSAHHGLAMNARGTKLCAAGTMSDYAAIVDRATGRAKVFGGKGRFLTGRTYLKPYWATEGPGNTCWVSMSGSDLVTVLDFRRERVVAEVPVGLHPQRVREGQVLESVVSGF